jgi:hypothetical protein
MESYSRNETDALLMKLEKRLGTRLGTYHNEQKTTLKVIGDDVVEIKEQCTKTNGRVGKLEDRANTIENWKWFITGGLAILGLLFIPLMFKFLA